MKHAQRITHHASKWELRLRTAVQASLVKTCRESTRMAMTTATELKNRLGAYLDAALSAPAFIQKSGGNVAGLISQQHYEYLQALEDEIWALRASLAEQSGYVGADTTQQLLHEMLHKDDTC